MYSPTGFCIVCLHTVFWFSLIDIKAECLIPLVQNIPNKICILSFTILFSFKFSVESILFDSHFSERKQNFQVHIETFKRTKDVGRWSRDIHAELFFYVNDGLCSSTWGITH